MFSRQFALIYNYPLVRICIMAKAVTELLNQIRSLPERQRMNFDHQYRRLQDREQKAALAEVRAWAKAKGITQQDIDDVCFEVRYGKKPSSRTKSSRRR